MLKFRLIGANRLVWRVSSGIVVCRRLAVLNISRWIELDGCGRILRVVLDISGRRVVLVSSGWVRSETIHISHVLEGAIHHNHCPHLDADYYEVEHRRHYTS